jgi:hypothetical protein
MYLIKLYVMKMNGELGVQYYTVLTLALDVLVVSFTLFPYKKK